MDGKAARIARLVNPSSGRSVIIPIDHGIVMGAIDGLKDPIEVLERLIALRIDATLLTPGLWKVAQPLFTRRDAPARVLTADLPLSSTLPGGPASFTENDLMVSVEFALRHAFDAVKVILLWGSGVPPEKKGDPLLIESAARVALELGADILKIPYTGEPEAFGDLVRRLRVPVFVLGGPKMGTLADIFSVAHHSVAAGARGIVFGRNVWQNPSMDAVVRGLMDVVHDSVAPKEALAKHGLA